MRGLGDFVTKYSNITTSALSHERQDLLPHCGIDLSV